jgi:hypothetical protein
MRAPTEQVEQITQSKFVCSACGSGRDCDCAAPALERLAEIKEQGRQRKREHDERKREEKQQPGNVTSDADDWEDAEIIEEAAVPAAINAMSEPDETLVEEPEVIKQNVLDWIDRNTAGVRAWKKVLKVSSLDHEAKDEVAVAIVALAREWTLLANSLVK